MLEELFSNSLEEFFDRETKNILNGVAERNLCSRLAIYLDANATKYKLSGYYADSEYNRNQNGKIKTILDDTMQ